MALNALRQLRPPSTSTRPLSSFRACRLFSTSVLLRQDVFHSQAEDPRSAAFLSSYQKPAKAAQTLTEKCFQRHALNLSADKIVRSGDFITLSPAICMTHDNSWPVATKFMSMGATKLHNPKQIVMTLDHDVQNESESNLKKYRMIKEFSQVHGVDFYGAGRGIGHQIMVEEGYAWPGTVCVASDSHSNMYGGVGCLGTPVVRTGAADIWATGSTWLRVPPIAKVTFLGTLPEGVTGKDIIVALCGLFNSDEVLNHAIEFQGSEETLRSIPIDDRLSIANMTTEWGALTGLFPIDSLLLGYLRYKATAASMFDMVDGASTPTGTTAARVSHARIDELEQNILTADPGARYAKSLFLDLSTVPPYVSGPNSVKVATPVHDLEPQNIKVDKAYLVSCTNSRASDLAAAAKVFKDAAARGEPSRIADHVKLYIAAASLPEQQLAEASGDWQILLQAGAIPLPSGCGPCIGLGTGLLEPGEVGISASNRNFKGRMGSTAAAAYLASPEVVAASALSGRISGPGWYAPPPGAQRLGVVGGAGDGIAARFTGVEEALEKLVAQADELIAASEGDSSGADAATPSAAVVPGFPALVTGEILFCDADNINTDGIYPGKYTYQDGVTPAQMAAVCMQNYDPSFASTVRPGDILVSGFNFGTGSSREQAATALLAAQVPLVVAGSFGNIFATNSINNALMGLEVPRLVQRLREVFASQQTASSGAPQEVTEPKANTQSLDSPPPGPTAVPAGEKQLTRRTGWTLRWDVAACVLEVQEGKGGPTWRERVPEIPQDVQRVVAGGGLVEARRAMFAKGDSA